MCEATALPPSPFKMYVTGVDAFFIRRIRLECSVCWGAGHMVWGRGGARDTQRQERFVIIWVVCFFFGVMVAAETEFQSLPRDELGLETLPLKYDRSGKKKKKVFTMACNHQIMTGKSGADTQSSEETLLQQPAEAAVNSETVSEEKQLHVRSTTVNNSHQSLACHVVPMHWAICPLEGRKLLNAPFEFAANALGASQLATAVVFCSR